MNWIQKFAAYLRPEFEEARMYWDKYLEHNPLRGRSETATGAMIAYLTEAAGDILREYSKDYRSDSYINEKIQRLKRELGNSANFQTPISENEVKWLAEIGSALEGLPTPSKEIELVKQLIGYMIRQELLQARMIQSRLHSGLVEQNLARKEDY